jgi:chemotaxis protein CheX
MDKLDTDKLVKHICAATSDVFATMLALAVENGEAYQEQAGSHIFDGLVSLIGLTGPWVGAGRISCSSALACRIAGAMFASEYTAVNEDVLDAMAELSNMIIGNVKSALEAELGPMGISIPTVIFGRNYQARSMYADDWTVVPFVCEDQRMAVKVCLVPSNEASMPRADLMHHGA